MSFAPASTNKGPANSAANRNAAAQKAANGGTANPKNNQVPGTLEYVAAHPGGYTIGGQRFDSAGNPVRTAQIPNTQQNRTALDKAGAAYSPAGASIFLKADTLQQLEQGKYVSTDKQKAEQQAFLNTYKPKIDESDFVAGGKSTQVNLQDNVAIKDSFENSGFEVKSGESVVTPSFQSSGKLNEPKNIAFDIATKGNYGYTWVSGKTGTTFDRKSPVEAQVKQNEADRASSIFVSSRNQDYYTPDEGGTNISFVKTPKAQGGVETPQSLFYESETGGRGFGQVAKGQNVRNSASENSLMVSEAKKGLAKETGENVSFSLFKSTDRNPNATPLRPKAQTTDFGSAASNSIFPASSSPQLNWDQFWNAESKAGKSVDIFTSTGALVGTVKADNNGKTIVEQLSSENQGLYVREHESPNSALGQAIVNERAKQPQLFTNISDNYLGGLEKRGDLNQSTVNRLQSNDFENYIASKASQGATIDILVNNKVVESTKGSSAVKDILSYESAHPTDQIAVSAYFPERESEFLSALKSNPSKYSSLPQGYWDELTKNGFIGQTNYKQINNVLQTQNEIENRESLGSFQSQSSQYLYEASETGAVSSFLRIPFSGSPVYQSVIDTLLKYDPVLLGDFNSLVLIQSSYKSKPELKAQTSIIPSTSMTDVLFLNPSYGSFAVQGGIKLIEGAEPFFAKLALNARNKIQIGLLNKIPVEATPKGATSSTIEYWNRIKSTNKIKPSNQDEALQWLTNPKGGVRKVPTYRPTNPTRESVPPLEGPFVQTILGSATPKILLPINSDNLQTAARSKIIENDQQQSQGEFGNIQNRLLEPPKPNTSNPPASTNLYNNFYKGLVTPTLPSNVDGVKPGKPYASHIPPLQIQTVNSNEAFNVNSFYSGKHEPVVPHLRDIALGVRNEEPKIQRFTGQAFPAVQTNIYSSANDLAESLPLSPTSRENPQYFFTSFQPFFDEEFVPISKKTQSQNQSSLTSFFDNSPPLARRKSTNSFGPNKSNVIDYSSFIPKGETPIDITTEIGLSNLRSRTFEKLGLGPYQAIHGTDLQSGLDIVNNGIKFTRHDEPYFNWFQNRFQNPKTFFVSRNPELSGFFAYTRGIINNGKPVFVKFDLNPSNISFSDLTQSISKNPRPPLSPFKKSGFAGVERSDAGFGRFFENKLEIATMSNEAFLGKPSITSAESVIDVGQIPRPQAKGLSPTQSGFTGTSTSKTIPTEPLASHLRDLVIGAKYGVSMERTSFNPVSRLLGDYQSELFKESQSPETRENVPKYREEKTKYQEKTPEVNITFGSNELATGSVLRENLGNYQIWKNKLFEQRKQENEESLESIWVKTIEQPQKQIIKRQDIPSGLVPSSKEIEGVLLTMYGGTSPISQYRLSSPFSETPKDVLEFRGLSGKPISITQTIPRTSEKEITYASGFKGIKTISLYGGTSPLNFETEPKTTGLLPVKSTNVIERVGEVAWIDLETGMYVRNFKFFEGDKAKLESQGVLSEFIGESLNTGQGAASDIFSLDSIRKGRTTVPIFKKLTPDFNVRYTRGKLPKGFLSTRPYYGGRSEAFSGFDKFLKDLNYGGEVKSSGGAILRGELSAEHDIANLRFGKWLENNPKQEPSISKSLSDILFGKLPKVFGKGAVVSKGTIETKAPKFKRTPANLFEEKPRESGGTVNIGAGGSSSVLITEKPPTTGKGKSRIKNPIGDERYDWAFDYPFARPPTGASSTSSSLGLNLDDILRFGPVIKSGSKTGINLKDLTENKNGLKGLPKIIISPKQNTHQKPKQKPDQSLIPKQIPKILQTPKQNTKPKQSQKHPTPLVPKTNQTQSPKFVPIRPFSPPQVPQYPSLKKPALDNLGGFKIRGKNYKGKSGPTGLENLGVQNLFFSGLDIKVNKGNRFEF